MTKIDGRKRNIPPLRKPFLNDETVTAIDFFVHELGARYPHLARHFGVNRRTVMAAVNRQGAYERIPAYVSKHEKLGEATREGKAND